MIYSELQFWVLVNVSTASLATADVQCEGYLTALGRTFGVTEYGDLTLAATMLDTSQPAPTDTGAIQSVAALVTVTAAEAEFDANRRGREAIKALLAAPFSAHLRAIETERGISLPDIREVYTYPTANQPQRATVVFPCAEVMPPSGPLDATS